MRFASPRRYPPPLWAWLSAGGHPFLGMRGVRTGDNPYERRGGGAHFMPRHAEWAPEARAAGRVDAQAALQQGQVPFDPSNPHAHRHPAHGSRRVQCLRVLEASAKHMGELGERVSLADQYPKVRPSGCFLGLVRRLEDPRIAAAGRRSVAQAPRTLSRWRGGMVARRT